MSVAIPLIAAIFTSLITLLLGAMAITEENGDAVFLVFGIICILCAVFNLIGALP